MNNRCEIEARRWQSCNWFSMFTFTFCQPVIRLGSWACAHRVSKFWMNCCALKGQLSENYQLTYDDDDWDTILGVFMQFLCLNCSHFPSSHDFRSQHFAQKAHAKFWSFLSVKKSSKLSGGIKNHKKKKLLAFMV